MANSCVFPLGLRLLPALIAAMIYHALPMCSGKKLSW